MTAGILVVPRRRATLEAVWLLAALLVAALVRAALNGHASLTAFAAGAAFGIALAAVAVAAGWRPSQPSVRSLVIGGIGGLVLVVMPRLLHPLIPTVIGMRPEPFTLWVLVTGLVVVGEEALLRGALFGALERSSGTGAAVVVTSLAFALMHVPLYGWQVVPLDVGVGVWLAGLRIATGGVGAPALAHLVADLSTWWL
jgi:membrane protease YdiL (CAAX protease family)